MYTYIWTVFIFRFRKGPHGHVHGTSNIILQIQTRENERTLRTILVQSQHSKGKPYYNMITKVVNKEINSILRNYSTKAPFDASEK